MTNGKGALFKSCGPNRFHIHTYFIKHFHIHKVLAFRLTDLICVTMVLFINTTPHRTPEQAVKACGKLSTQTFMPLEEVIWHLNLK